MIYKLQWKNQAELTFEFDQLTIFAEIPSVIDPKTLQSLMFFCERKGDNIGLFYFYFFNFFYRGTEG